MSYRGSYSDFTEQYMGSGVGLSNLFNEVSQSTEVVTGEDKINNSIRMILSTRIGERVMLPEFGSKLYKVIFEPNDLIAADLIDIYVREALGRWENRIIVTNVSVGHIGSSGDENVAPVFIYYRLRNSNIESCYIYPYNVSSDGEENIYNLGDNAGSVMGSSVD